jgi:prepilin-type N-terminal cleavage/methylation domain-containing protein
MRNSESGFSLIEVLMALAILAIVTVVLLGRRVEIVRDTAEAKERRLAWALAAQLMTEIETSTSLQGEGGSFSGDFMDLGKEKDSKEWQDQYGRFLYRWEAVKEDVPTNDSKETLPKKIFRVKVAISTESIEDLVTLEGMFPVPVTPTGSGS